MTASYTLSERTSLPLKHYIYEACKTVVGQHPILSAIPVHENSNDPQFVRLPEINLDRCVFFHDRRHGVPDGLSDSSSSQGSDAHGDADLDELLTIQHNTPFEPPHPFWRLCVLMDVAHPHYVTAAFVFHHAIGDGTSGMAFHRTFHQALSQAVSTASDLDVTSIIQSPSAPLLPSVEALHPMPVSIFHVLTVLFKEKVWSSRDPGLWTGSKISVPLDNRVRHFALSPSNSLGFVDACRANGTTVTAALQTLVAGVLFSHLPNNFTNLKCAGAISTRRWLPDVIDDDSIGVFVQDLKEDYSRQHFQTERLPWSEAQRSRKTIEQVLALKGKNAGPNMLRYINNYQRELFLPKVGKERASTYEVSNLGVFRSRDTKDDKGPSVGIGRMVFTQSANVSGSAFEVSAVSGKDGCLVLCFSWQNGVVDDTLINEVMKGVAEEVTRLVRS